MSDNETLADIAVEMRTYFQTQKRNGNPEHRPWHQVLSDWADRAEAAAARERGKWERERRAYEKLHDCFWDENAIQSIVRQMLDARDDLRHVDPREADDLEYYAHELMRVARSAPGNAAALRKALEDTEELLEHFAKPGTMLHSAFFLHMRDNRAALSAPTRNCDIGTSAEQARRFQKFCHLVRTRSCDCSNNCPFINEPDIIHCQFAWAQMPYEAKGGEK